MSGVTRAVTWLWNSGAQKAKTASLSPRSMAELYSAKILKLSDTADPPSRRSPHPSQRHPRIHGDGLRPEPAR